MKKGDAAVGPCDVVAACESGGARAGGCGSNPGRLTCEGDMSEKEFLEREAHLGWEKGET